MEKNNRKSFIVIFVTTLVLVLIFSIAIFIFVFILEEQKILREIRYSAQSYYTAEAGIEDALLRLKKKLPFSNLYNLRIGNATATIEISPVIGGSRTIISTGNFFNRIKKIRVGYSVSTQKVSFHYGAQVGGGGMLIGNNAIIKGNVYSNGNVIAPGGQGNIENSVTVAINGNRIEGLTIGENATVHTCKNSKIGKTLTYVSGGGIQNCTAKEEIKIRPNEIPPLPLPIPQSQIDTWKQEAESGGIIVGNYLISGKITQNLGPKKITGDLTIDNNAILNMTGTIWVVGNLRIDNGATIQLDSNAYGLRSGVIVVDGKIKVRPNTYLKGSGEKGSYLLLLSTNPEVSDTANPAIEVDNNADAAIFYTTQGLIVLRNKIKVREVTGYKIFLDNNAEILYESGLEEATFTSGPGGSWEVVSWEEIE